MSPCVRESVCSWVNTMTQQKENAEVNRKSKKRNRRYESYSTFRKHIPKKTPRNPLPQVVGEVVGRGEGFFRRWRTATFSATQKPNKNDPFLILIFSTDYSRFRLRTSCEDFSSYVSFLPATLTSCNVFCHVDSVFNRVLLKLEYLLNCLSYC